jgi:hypothetical protein
MLALGSEDKMLTLSNSSGDTILQRELKFQVERLFIFDNDHSIYI